MRRLLICITAMAAISLAMTAEATAYDGCDYGYGYGYLYNSLRYEVPHFAAYPPVYYSYPVPRTYGYSPFAYPPHVMTPEIVSESKPVTIINPHVPRTQQKAVKAKSDRTAAASAPIEPLIVVNPFVAPNRSVVQVAR
jgi:hypothetical protein